MLTSDNLEKLLKDIGGIGRKTYSVDGVTLLLRNSLLDKVNELISVDRPLIVVSNQSSGSRQ